MEEIIIDNITTQSFFRYTKTTETDVQYNKILVELLQTDEEEGKASLSSLIELT